MDKARWLQFPQPDGHIFFVPGFMTGRNFLPF
jgi:hypothetical protein